MKSLSQKLFSLLVAVFLTTSGLLAQFAIDTIAYQDFETVPAAPVWGFNGTLNDLQSGFASPTSCIPGTPLGIGGSQAWHVVQVSSGNPITFNNTVIPSGYDSVRVSFNLAGLNLNGSTGGPDNLDYVLVEYSLDNGATFVSRLRVRGSIQNNSFWAYDATGIAAVPYLPASEALFQPTSSSGLQVAQGYSFCEISFPGNISQLMVRITPRSSSSTDSWLVDNLVLTGESACPLITNSITEVSCGSYVSPSGNTYGSSGVYVDTIPSASGCDSIITIDLTVNPLSTLSITEVACDSYTSPSGAVYTSSGIYEDTLVSSTGCDSIISIDLTVNQSSSASIIEVACDSYTSPGGNVYTNSGIFNDVIVSSTGCDSTITIELTVNASTSSSITEIGLDVYTAPSGATYTSSGVYQDTITNSAGCDSIITIDLTMSYTGIDDPSLPHITITPNPAIDVISIQGLSDAMEVESISIVNLMGAITHVSNVTESIDISKLDAGVYFIQLNYASTSQQIRFVKN